MYQASEVTCPAQALAALDHIADGIDGFDSVMALWPQMVELAGHLQRTAPDDGWKQTLRNHKVAEIALQDPMAAWSYARPRGYPGDARLIDFIYGHAAVQSLVDNSTPLGLNINAFTYQAETSVAVRERRRLMARLIDSISERVADPEILVVACGHMRELEFTTRMTDVGRLVALDQDGESLAEIRTRYPHLSGVVDTVQASVGRLAVRPAAYGNFDLIYAAGLYDYLAENTATRLTTALFGTLKPGGHLLFANFAMGIRQEAYMDAFMNWRLLLREEADLQRILEALPRDEVARTRLFRGSNGAVIYALAVRR